MLSFFPRDVLDEILNLIESVSEGFPSYSYRADSISILKITKGNNSTKNLGGAIVVNFCMSSDHALYLCQVS